MPKIPLQKILCDDGAAMRITSWEAVAIAKGPSGLGRLAVDYFSFENGTTLRGGPAVVPGFGMAEGPRAVPDGTLVRTFDDSVTNHAAFVASLPK